MPSPTTKLSLSKQTLIRLIVDHSRLHESIGTWAIGYDPTAGGWRTVWLGPISASGRRVCRVGSRLEERPLAAHPGPQT